MRQHALFSNRTARLLAYPALSLWLVKVLVP